MKFKQFALIIALVVAVFSMAGCSLLPRITFDKAGVTPTSTEKSMRKEMCSGEYTLDEQGYIKTCSKGYYNYEQNYKQAERAYTWKERMLNFIRNLAGIWFWVLVAVIFLVPGALGWFISGFFNVAKTALTSTVKAIAKFKSDIPKVVVNGVEVEDPAYVKAVDDLLDALETEHAQNVEVMKTIAKIRLQLKIEDKD